MATATPTNFGSAAGTTFATAAGVASLDTPQLNQTKLEIRTLVSEVANLAASDIDLSAFIQGALPRICSAMGATAAAIWSLDSAAGETHLLGHHHLPEHLIGANGSNEPSATPLSTDQQHHQRILLCVASEGSAVLVPPKSTQLGVDRPANPLEESLLIVPIKIDDCYDTLLEVIQPHSGGPAAQRGYLRFVAQMADLIAEYLRKGQLRTLKQSARYVESLRRGLAECGSVAEPTGRLQVLTQAWVTMLHADLAFALTPRAGWGGWLTRRHWKVAAISDVKSFDSRSQVILAIENWIARDAADQLHGAQWFSKHKTPDGAQSSQVSTEHLYELLACQHVLLSPVNASCLVLLTYSRDFDSVATLSQAQELASAFSPLIDSAGTKTSTQPQRNSWWQQIERWIVRLSTVLLGISLALFPVPDSLSTIAVLEAVDKEFYYAPSAATVKQVAVDHQQSVKPGDLIVELMDSQLQAQIEALEGQQLSTRLQLEQDRAAQLRGASSGRATEDELNLRIEQAKVTLAATQQQLEILHQQAEELQIRARSQAVVSTYDTVNRLQGRPVVAGQLLLTTRAVDTDWQLKLNIPERHIGRVQQALAAYPAGLVVHFALSSHPGSVYTGRLVSVSKQLAKDQQGNASITATVLVNSQELPAKNDGAVARASVNCGRTFAGWLIVRDAYRQAINWWRML